MSHKDDQTNAVRNPQSRQGFVLCMMYNQRAFVVAPVAEDLSASESPFSTQMHNEHLQLKDVLLLTQL